MATKQKVLIANRGEIAVRIIRTCRDLGLPTVAVYSDADRDALHVEMADQSFRIGPALASESYLSIGAILEAAHKARATLIHPGYGFLAERAHFAKAVEETGFTFVGPSADAIEQMGDKAAARVVADRAGVPIVPGTPEAVDIRHAKKQAERVGFPLLVKAAFGGGGKGMHVVRDAEHLEEALRRAAREAQSYFGRPEVFLERYVDRAHHVEAQVIADTRGNVFFLGERDCTVQRRHQKLIEETPSPVMDEQMRTRFAEAAISLTKGSGYVNAGTIECIVDEDGSFYFLEMNTRLQVEHTVTEMVTGYDMVALQLQVAMGEKLDLVNAPRGAAIQCRINAEDPGRNFLPGPGRITRYEEPGRPVRSRGLRGDRRARRPRGLRLDVREADRLGREPGARTAADARSPLRVQRGGRAHHHPDPRVDPAFQGVPHIGAHDELAGAGAHRCGLPVARGHPARRRVGKAPRDRPTSWSRSTGSACRCGSSTSGAPRLRGRPRRRRRTTASTSTVRSARRCRERSSRSWWRRARRSAQARSSASSRR